MNVKNLRLPVCVTGHQKLIYHATAPCAWYANAATARQISPPVVDTINSLLPPTLPSHEATSVRHAQKLDIEAKRKV
jgi:hypothetical protein